MLMYYSICTGGVSLCRLYVCVCVCVCYMYVCCVYTIAVDCFVTYTLYAVHCLSRSDVNECQHSSTCHQICSNTAGSYRCSCYNGYQLRSDQHNCEGTKIVVLCVVCAVQL